MKFLVLSDSHRRLRLMEQIIGQLHIDDILFLGDHYDDMRAVQRQFPDKRFTGIAGNCDFNCEVDSQQEISVCGKKIWLTHGHHHSVKSGHLRLQLAAMELGADACLFGHSHVPELFYERGILFMNPGSISEPRGQYQESYGILEVDEGGIRGSVVEVSPAGLRPIF